MPTHAPSDPRRDPSPPPDLSRIVIATGNPGKVAEIRSVLAQADLETIELLGLDECEGAPFEEPIEGRNSFLENATIKAIGYARQTGLPCLADDSGLMVDALGGSPGVISSHYATNGEETGLPRQERDRANNRVLIQQLEGVPEERRSARFVCTMVLTAPDGVTLATTEGAFEGRIGLPPRVPEGEYGFGYDPLLLVAPDFERTAAELEPQEKNERSHRGAAARAMAQKIAELVG